MSPVEEQCFPRGGKIKGKSHDSTRKKKKTDDLFTDVKSKPGKKKGKKGKRASGKKGVKREPREKRDVVDAVPLKQEDLEPQMVILGRIRDVQDLQLLISLPCHMIGLVPATHISAGYSKLLTASDDGESAPSLDSLFSRGQYVSCMLVKADITGKRVRNTLSINPSDVNAAMPASALSPGMLLQCAVRSDEDKVFDMDCGIPGTRAVLPKKSLGKRGGSLTAGQVAWCMVDSVTSASGVYTVTLTADPARLNGAEVASGSDLTPQTLLPGMRLPVTVKQILRGGLQVGFLSTHSGFVYKTQLDEAIDSPNDYNVGASAHARVLYTLPRVRHTYLSIRPPAPAEFNLPEFPLQCPARLLDKDKSGIRLVLEQTPPAAAFCPFYRADKREIKACTLIGYDAMDDIYIASLKEVKQVSTQKYALGQQVRCKVKGYNEFGCEVELKEGGDGFVPFYHLTNVPVKDPQAMFPVGKKLKCRVIQVDPARRRVWLTHNARLLNSDVQLASDASALKRGDHAHLIVCRVSEAGLVMSGCNDVTGFIPAHKLQSTSVTDHFPGQILHCAVVGVTTKDGERRTTLQLACDADDDASSVGVLTTVRVHGQASDRLLVETAEGRKAVLPGGHLTDIPEHAKPALGKYPVDTKIETVVFHSRDGKTIVSAKPLLLEAVKKKTYPDTVAAAYIGMQLPCALVRHDEKGVLVGFPCAGLGKLYRIPLQGLCDGWQTDASQLQSLQHRTLLAEVTGVFPETGGLRLRARLEPRTDRCGVPYLRRCLTELSALFGPLPAPGEQVTVRATKRQPSGIRVTTEDGRRGLLLSDNPVKSGQQVTASVIQVSLTGDLVLTQDSTQIGDKRSVCEGARYLARLVGPPVGYSRSAILQPPAPPCVVQLPIRRGLNDLTSGRQQKETGSDLYVVVKRASGSGIVAVDAAEASAKRKRRNNDRSPGRVAKPNPKRHKRTLPTPKPKPKPKPKRSATLISYTKFSFKDD